jgi:hypothetical protein
MRALSRFFGCSFFAFHLHPQTSSQQYGFQSGNVCLGGLRLKIRCVGTRVAAVRGRSGRGLIGQRKRERGREETGVQDPQIAVSPSRRTWKCFRRDPSPTQGTAVAQTWVNRGTARRRTRDS